MTSADKLGTAYFIFIFTLIFIQLLGSGYRGLRFVYNYEITTAPIVACTKEHKSDQDIGGEWYEYDIELAGVEYPIFVIGEATQREWGWSMFKTPPPVLDWCQLKGQKVTAYHYKPVRGGIIFRNPPKEPLGLFALLSKMESGGATVGVVLLGVLAVISVISGLYLLVSIAHGTLSHVVIPRRQEHGVVAYIKLINDLVVPFVSWLLASMLAFVFGLILIKGMLFVETRYDFLIGLIVFVGGTLMTVAPAMLLKFVYAVKTSNSEWVKLVTTILMVVAFTPLLTSWYTLLMEGNFTELSVGGFGKFLFRVLTSVFP